MEKRLGKITKEDLRNIFPNEAGDFTPWLEKNIDRLSEAIGIEIGEVRREKEVGSFSCDLIATEMSSEDKIIIENQLEITNHDHLGKLLTYAAGIGAKYIVWIAKSVREEHLKALEWLNESMNEISFFGVEIVAIKIDDSAPALDFKVVVEPNSWSKEIRENSEQLDERHRKYLQFYTRLVAEYEKSNPEWGHLTARHSHWLAFGAGKSGFRFSWAFRSDNRFNVELYIDTKNKEEIKGYFAELKEYQSEINQSIPNLSWEELPDRRGSRIALYHKLPTSVKNLNNEQVDEIIKWAIEKMNIFKKVFTPYIKKLD